MSDGVTSVTYTGQGKWGLSSGTTIRRGRERSYLNPETGEPANRVVVAGRPDITQLEAQDIQRQVEEEARSNSRINTQVGRSDTASIPSPNNNVASTNSRLSITNPYEQQSRAYNYQDLAVSQIGERQQIDDKLMQLYPEASNPAEAMRMNVEATIRGEKRYTAPAKTITPLYTNEAPEVVIKETPVPSETWGGRQLEGGGGITGAMTRFSTSAEKAFLSGNNARAGQEIYPIAPILSTNIGITTKAGLINEEKYKEARGQITNIGSYFVPIIGEARYATDITKVSQTKPEQGLAMVFIPSVAGVGLIGATSKPVIKVVSSTYKDVSKFVKNPIDTITTIGEKGILNTKGGVKLGTSPLTKAEIRYKNVHGITKSQYMKLPRVGQNNELVQRIYPKEFNKLNIHKQIVETSNYDDNMFKIRSRKEIDVTQKTIKKGRITTINNPQYVPSTINKQDLSYVPYVDIKTFNNPNLAISKTDNIKYLTIRTPAPKFENNVLSQARPYLTIKQKRTGLNSAPEIVSLNLPKKQAREYGRNVPVPFRYNEDKALFDLTKTTQGYTYTKRQHVITDLSSFRNVPKDEIVKTKVKVVPSNSNNVPNAYSFIISDLITYPKGIALKTQIVKTKIKVPPTTTNPDDIINAFALKNNYLNKQNNIVDNKNIKLFTQPKNSDKPITTFNSETKPVTNLVLVKIEKDVKTYASPVEVYPSKYAYTKSPYEGFRWGGQQQIVSTKSKATEQIIGGYNPVQQITGKKKDTAYFLSYDDEVVNRKNSVFNDVGVVNNLQKQDVKTDYMIAQKQDYKIGQKQDVKTDYMIAQKQDVKTMQDVKTDYMIAQKQDVKTMQDVKTDYMIAQKKQDVQIKQKITPNIIIPIIITPTKTTSITSSVIKPLPIIQTNNFIPDKTKPRVFTPEVFKSKFKVPIVNKEKTKLINKNNIKSKSSSSGFITLLKIKGKFKAVSPITSRESALDIGANLAKRTLSATFKIVPVQGKVTELKTSGEFARSKNEFRNYAIRKGQAVQLQDTYIQRAGTRLGTQSERLAIQGAKKSKGWF